MRYIFLLLMLCLPLALAGCSGPQDEASLSEQATTLFNAAQQDIEAGRDAAAMGKILDVIDINQQRLEMAEQSGDKLLFEDIAQQQLEIIEMTLPQCVFTAQFDDAMWLAGLKKTLIGKVHGEDHYSFVDTTDQISRLQTLQKLKPPELEQYFETTDAMANAEELVSGDQAAKAKELIEESIATRKRLLGENYVWLSNDLYMLGAASVMVADFDKAEKYLLKSLAICRERFPRLHPTTASTLNGLGRLYFETADYKKAVIYHRECLEISRAAEGDVSTATAWALDDLGNTLASMGDFHAARAAIEEGLKIRKQLHGEEHPDTATSQSDLATVLVELGQFEESLRLTQQSLATRKKVLGESHSDTLNSMLNLSMTFTDFAEYDKAEQILRRHLEISLEHFGAEHAHVAHCNTSLGMLYKSKGDLVAAEPCYQKSLLLNQKIFGDTHPDADAARLNLAGLYSVMGDYEKAESLLRVCLKNSRETFGENHPSHALVLCNLSGCVASNGDVAEAESLAQKSLEIYQRLSENGNVKATSAMYNLARIYSMQGKYDESTAVLQKATTLIQKELGDKHPETAKALFALAYANMLSGNLDQVEVLLEKGVAIIRQFFGQQHEDMASYWGTRASLEWARGNIEQASEHYAKADAIYRKLANEAALVQSERQQLKMAQQSMDLFHLQLSMMLSSERNQEARNLFEQSLRWKGGVLMRQRQMRRAAVNDEAIKTIRKLQMVTMQLATLSRLRPQGKDATNSWNKEALKLTEEKERLERELSRQTASSKAPDQVTAEAVLNALPEDAVLINFLEFHKTTLDALSGKTVAKEEGPHLMAFVARPGKSVAMIELASSKESGAAIDTWRQGFGDTAEAKQAGRNLRQTLWQPLEQYLEGASTVIVSTDGPLGRLPLGVLPGRKEGEYLLEDHRLAYVPVPQLIPGLLKSQPAAGGGLLTMGDVNYNAAGAAGKPSAETVAVRATAPAVRGGTNWQSLAGAAAEVKAIREFHDEVFGAVEESQTLALAGSGATEQQFRDQAPSFQHLHLATHGFFADPSLSSAASQTAGLGHAGAFDIDKFQGYNPGLLSGIVFAGANQQPEQGADDGILTAQEIAFIPLDNVEMVTLSACETGLGQAAGGEGLLGVQRAFQVAGARSTLASLWKVPDQATRMLMLRIYRNLWEKKMSRLDAVREAQLYMLKNPTAVGEITRGDLRLGAPKPQDTPGRLPPWYWAAFILSGDWR